MKRPLCVFAVALLAAAPLGAATRWEAVNADVDETIADTSESPPSAMMHPLLTDVPFSNFRYPHVDLEENVTFIADDPVYSKKAAHHGIYRSIAKPPGELHALVRKGDVALPGSSYRFVWFRGLQVDGADFVFNATDTAHERGLYYWSGGRVQLIARSHVTILPGVKLPLTDVEYGALSDSRILYNARAGSENLLVLHELRTGEARIVCRTGMPIPGSHGAEFRYISPQNWLDGSNVVFRAADIDEPHRETSDASGRRGLFGWFGINWRQPESAFDPARMATLADGETPVPLLPGRRFNDIRSAPVRSGLVAFVAGGTGFTGVYYCDITSERPAVRPVVDTESALAGVFAGNFESFQIFCSVFDKSIVFIGHATNGYVGVFLYRTDHDELFLLCDSRTRIGAKLPVEFEIAGDFLVRNRFAITARFDDDSSGVYLATIPARSFKRLSE